MVIRGEFCNFGVMINQSYSLHALSQKTSRIEEEKLLEQRLIYGLLPEVIDNPDNAETTLRSLVERKIYSEIPLQGSIRKLENYQKLVVTLALKTGEQITFNELSRITGLDKITVENYLNLLELNNVIFTIPSYSTGKPYEISQGKKLYFHDNGIRNAIVSNFVPANLRGDTEALWENLIVNERIKYNSSKSETKKTAFWRTYTGQYIPYLELGEGGMEGFNFCWNKQQKVKTNKSFLNAYPGTLVRTITRKNYWDFVSQISSNLFEF